MTRFLLLTATLCTVALVAALVFAPSWPTVVALVALLAACVAVYAALLWSERDARLDAKGRADATKAAELSELIVGRLKSHEETLNALRSSSAAAGMNPLRGIR